MAGFCVILSGRLPGDKDDASVWAPLMAALKLDTATFSQRILTALPLTLRRSLDQAAAKLLAELMRAQGISALVVQDEIEVAYFKRMDVIRGPLPRSALKHFIQRNEPYRLRGERDWRIWDAAAVVGDAIFSEQSRKALDEPILENISTPGQFDGEPMPLPGDVVEAVASSDALAAASTSSPVSTPGVRARFHTSAASFFAAPGHAFKALKLTCQKKRSSIRQLMGRLGNWDFGKSAFRRKVASAKHYVRGHLPGAFRVAYLRRSIDDLKTLVFSRFRATDWVAAVLLIALIGESFSSLHLNYRTTLLALQTAPVVVQQIIPTVSALLPTFHVAPKVSAAAPTIVGTSIPGTTLSATSDCQVDALSPGSPEEITLLGSGLGHLMGRSVRAGVNGEIYVVEAALGYDGVCRPSPYQLYVFYQGRLAGTLSPQAMAARTDGAISDFKLLDSDHLQLVIEHYKPSDPVCCASSHELKIVDLRQYGDAQLATSLESQAASVDASGIQEDAGSGSLDCMGARPSARTAPCFSGALGGLGVEAANGFRKTSGMRNSGQSLIQR